MSWPDVRPVRAAYDETGAAWARGPARMYRRLAAALLAPVGVTGRRVLDIGAGTGVASAEAVARGAAQVVATDSAFGMLAQRPAGIVALGADAGALPFADDAFDLAVLAFVLGHLEDPVAALGEARRVATEIAASCFDASWAHPAKEAVDGVMAGSGFVVPEWYRQMKDAEGAVSDPDRLAGLAQAAGFAEVTVVRVHVEAGLETPEDLVAWRWGMAHLAPYVATLGDQERATLHAACLGAVRGMGPVVVPMLVLSAR